MRLCKNVAMPSIDPRAKEWQLAWAERIGNAIQDRRKQLGLTAQELARRTEKIGYPISRVAISKIESNSRAGKIDVAEVAVLAMALGSPPVMLLYPGLPHTSYRYLPNAQHYAIDALMWFTGESLNLMDDGEAVAGSWEEMRSAAQPLTLSREFVRAEVARRVAELSAKKARALGDLDESESQMRYARAQLALTEQILTVMRALRLPISTDYPPRDEDADLGETV
jgi:transcriptional regulator with XRE-family HTH domain